jgi:hypothetical protein
MQHHEVADMFGRRVRPRLSIYHSQLRKPRGSYPAGALAECIVGIRNNGRGIARFPRLVLEPVNRCAAEAPYGLDGNGHNNLRRETWHTGAMVYSGGANDVVHPESVLEVTRLGISFVEIDPVQAQIAYTIFAEGVPPVRDILVLGQAELATMDRS